MRTETENGRRLLLNERGGGEGTFQGIGTGMFEELQGGRE